MSVFYEILKIEYILNELKTEINNLNDDEIDFGTQINIYLSRKIGQKKSFFAILSIPNTHQHEPLKVKQGINNKHHNFHLFKLAVCFHFFYLFIDTLHKNIIEQIIIKELFIKFIDENLNNIIEIQTKQYDNDEDCLNTNFCSIFDTIIDSYLK